MNNLQWYAEQSLPWNKSSIFHTTLLQIFTADNVQSLYNTPHYNKDLEKKSHILVPMEL